MTRFVEGDGVLFVFCDDLGALLQPANDAVHGIQKVLVGHKLAVFPRCKQSRLVAHVGDVGTAEPWRLFRKEVDVHGVVRLDGPQVNVKNCLALIHVWHVHVNLAVKAPGAHQGLVEDVGPVGRRQNDDAAVGAKPVHLRQQLIQRVFAFVVGTEVGVLAASPANGIDLVDENDGWRLFLGLLEKVANP